MNPDDYRLDLDKIEAMLEKGEGMLAKAHGGNMNVRIEGSGNFALWIAGTCCAICLVVTGAIGFLYLDQQAQIRQLNEYLTATYMLCPALKPEDYGK